MAHRILIVGYGTAGISLATDLRRRGLEVVGFLDDNATEPEVLGRLADVNEIIVQHRIDVVHIAIPSGTAKTVRDFIDAIESPDVELGIVPRTYGTLSKESVDLADLTDVDVLDLVGRAPVKHDLLAAREFIAGRRVLVTGAAGSIGSRLTQLIVAMDPAGVTAVDASENGVFRLGESLGPRENVALRIADITNARRMEQIFAEARPDLVFHAAAFKHVPLMQDNPIEAINNNVGGTLAMMRLAIAHGSSDFVMISTDKAVNPVNVMGSTKRLGEMLMQALSAGEHYTKFSAVRFGNVIESNGSVVETFRAQIANKQPLTVTHPDITRFFMTIDEASHLVIQSAMLADHSEIFVLDMGEPVKIADLARSLIHAVDRSLDIEFVGLRPGEKMFEELSYDLDKVDRTSNSKIFIVRDELPFDHEAFLTSIETLLDDTREYRISADDAITRLREMGFAVQ